MVNSVNQYRFLCLREPKKKVHWPLTRLWDVRKFHTHVSVLSVWRLQLSGFLRGWGGWKYSSSVSLFSSKYCGSKEPTLLVSKPQLSISKACVCRRA